MSAPDISGEESANPPEILTDADELLYRQIHPSWIDRGQLTPMAFFPGDGDDGRLSIALSSRTTPEAAFTTHTVTFRLKSAGTVGILVGEVEDPSVTAAASGYELRAYGHPIEGDPAHGYIDFGELGDKRRRAVARLLMRKARDRGWRYQPPGSMPTI
ncbi:MAG: hypothetical protein ACRD6W_06710 [Nitrososphaerales archaeon]